MNKIKEIERLNNQELEEGISINASWHNDYNDTAYIYIGGLNYDLTEGDLITIFSQYGKPTHVKLIRDKETGKSRGFGYLRYEDQRSTALAVDNLSGTEVAGRKIVVDHSYYEPREGEEIDAL